MTKIAFIGAGSTIFTRNILGDCLLEPALHGAEFRLMDIDEKRLDETVGVAERMVASAGTPTRITRFADRRAAMDGADFVIVAFQIGGYRPATVTDFEIPRAYGLRQTIGDTLGVGGIMRGLRTVPHLWALAEDMVAVCPDGLLLQYVNPMAINTWALAERFPKLRQVGLCHSVQNSVTEIAHDLDLAPDQITHRVAGINHVAFFLELSHQGQSLYPRLLEGYRNGSLPKPPLLMPRCRNLVRYEVMAQMGYFCTESSEHLAEYVPWFIKSHRPDLIAEFAIPLDEYPKRCEEQIAEWDTQAGKPAPLDDAPMEIGKSPECAAAIMRAMTLDEPLSIHGNLPNRGQMPQLPPGCAVETPCLVDGNGVQPVVVDGVPPQLIALMRSQINVQELVVRALVDENIEHVYHAAMMDPHTAAELDLRQIRALVGDLLKAHHEILPEWARYGAS